MFALVAKLFTFTVVGLCDDDSGVSVNLQICARVEGEGLFKYLVKNIPIWEATEKSNVPQIFQRISMWDVISKNSIW